MNEKIMTIILVVLIALAGLQTFQLATMSGVLGGTSTGASYTGTTTAGQNSGYSAPAPQMVGGC